MMSAGYNDPNYGLPSDAGGSFIGVGEMTKCIMPLPIMPATPPGGLFGPDAFVPFWGNPGYDTPPDISNPGVYMPLPPGVWDEINSILADPGLGGAVGGRPSFGWGSLSSIGKSVILDEKKIRRNVIRKYRRGLSMLTVPAPPGANAFVNIAPKPKPAPYRPPTKTYETRFTGGDIPGKRKPRPSSVIVTGGGDYHDVHGLTWEDGEEKVEKGRPDYQEEVRKYKRQAEWWRFVLGSHIIAPIVSAAKKVANRIGKWWGGIPQEERFHIGLWGLDVAIMGVGALIAAATGIVTLTPLVILGFGVALLHILLLTGDQNRTIPTRQTQPSSTSRKTAKKDKHEELWARDWSHQGTPYKNPWDIWWEILIGFNPNEYAVISY
jgi:hypothetical protein